MTENSKKIVVGVAEVWRQFPGENKTTNVG